MTRQDSRATRPTLDWSTLQTVLARTGAELTITSSPVAVSCLVILSDGAVHLSAGTNLHDELVARLIREV